MNSCGSQIAAISAGVLLCSAVLAAGGDSWDFTRVDSFGDKLLLQGFASASSTNYPMWKPGTEPCPMAPEQAIALSTNRRNALLQDDGRWRVGDVKLRKSFTAMTNELWFYEVEHFHRDDAPTEGTWTAINVMVGLDAPVPLKELAMKKPRLPPLENRPVDARYSGEELQRHLSDYKMDVIRAGLPALPIPLTREEDTVLVKEGVLPPQTR